MGMQVATARNGKDGRLMIPVMLLALKRTSQQRVDDDTEKLTARAPAAYHYLTPTIGLQVPTLHAQMMSLPLYSRGAVIPTSATSFSPAETPALQRSGKCSRSET